MPMKRSLTHLNAIRAFESVARHLSFAKAAQELHVTPGAVSQQVKSLEGYLGVELFRRTKRGILLTEAGQAVLPDIREGMERIANGVAKLRHQRGREILTVTVSPSFAAKWLIPRLERFRERHPGIDIRLDTTARLVEMESEGVDVAVRYGSGSYPGLEVTPFLTERVFPVCAPEFIDGPHPLRVPEDLRWHALLHDDTMEGAPGFPTWPLWLEKAGVKDPDPSRGIHFNSSMLVIQAALNGQGVALGRSVIVDDDLRAGRLLKPFTLDCSLRFAYHIVYPPKSADLPRAATFIQWLLDEAGNPEPGDRERERL